MKKNAFDVLSPQDVKDMEARHRKYIGLVQKERKFSLEQALDVCKLTDYDKRQWTILHDQLVTHFKDFRTFFSLNFILIGKSLLENRFFLIQNLCF